MIILFKKNAKSLKKAILSKQNRNTKTCSFLYACLRAIIPNDVPFSSLKHCCRRLRTNFLLCYRLHTQQLQTLISVKENTLEYWFFGCCCLLVSVLYQTWLGRYVFETSVYFLIFVNPLMKYVISSIGIFGKFFWPFCENVFLMNDYLFISWPNYLFISMIKK